MGSAISDFALFAILFAFIEKDARCVGLDDLSWRAGCFYYIKCLLKIVR